MSNFDWENIEKEADHKKLTGVIVVLALLIAFGLYYKMEIYDKSRESIITEKVRQENRNKNTSVQNKSDNVYTVRIGRFIDFDSARDFVMENSLEVFTIYSEDNDIFVNIGRIPSYEKAQKRRDDFFSKGYPAYVEVFQEYEDISESMETQEDKHTQDNGKDKNIAEISVEKDMDKAENEEEHTVKAESEDKTEETEERGTDIISAGGPDNDLESGYVIQVAALEDLEDATLLKNRLRFSGIESRIIRENSYFKVQIGFFETRREAEEYAAERKGKAINDYFIKKAGK
ncbi:MAG: SPOR domain-containing protein [Candidatus Muiribacteriaceae bacterium]